jgi:hypothetical protein
MEIRLERRSQFSLRIPEFTLRSSTRGYTENSPKCGALRALTLQAGSGMLVGIGRTLNHLEGTAV